MRITDREIQDLKDITICVNDVVSREVLIDLLESLCDMLNERLDSEYLYSLHATPSEKTQVTMEAV